MKQIFNILFIVALTATVQAQNIDEDKMYRDIEVAENALNTILSPEKKQYPMWGNEEENIDGDYIQGYGVIFMVANNRFARVKLYKMDGASKEVIFDNDRQFEEKDDAYDQKEHFIEKSKTFLADYAGIIGQLDDNQMISVRWGANNRERFDFKEAYIAQAAKAPEVKTAWIEKMESNTDSELIVEVTVAKIKALRMGKISRDDFFKSVNVIENVIDNTKDADLETLSAMFHRLYEKDLSKTYYSEREPKYSKLSNFGVIVKMKIYSSYEDNKIYSMPTIAKKGLTLEERNKFVMDLLPQFESEFKENLVNYGRTLKNLDSEEILLFEINMTTCKGCKDFPKTMKFSVKKSVLNKYNLGEYSLKEAIKMVKVERILD
jgi:hypothetical protein